jgi:hypothetical protein
MDLMRAALVNAATACEWLWALGSGLRVFRMSTPSAESLKPKAEYLRA